MRTLWVTLMLTSLALAGCSEEAAGPEEPPLDVTETTGCIRGVVVDSAIRPIEGATVTILSTGQTQLTGVDGSFTFCDLEAGTYFVQANKLLYEPTQTSAAVVAGDANPKGITIQIARIPGVTPYVEQLQFQGYYECAFAYFFITDSCDMAVRTVHDAGVTVVPRNIQDNRNTQFAQFSDGIQTIIQEGFWDNSATPRMWMMVDSTPIDNGCDCSDHTYVTAIGESPTYGRADVPETVSAPGNWPEVGADVAIRGFVPFTSGPDDVQYALGVDFQIFTTFFHGYVAPEGWNIQQADQYPVPE